MTRALVAVFRSRSVGLADKLHLTPTEVVDVALRLAVEHAAKAGMSPANLNSALGDILAAHAVEGSDGGGDAE